MYFLYGLAIIFYALLLAPRFLYHIIRYGKYTGTLAERWGWLPDAINPGGLPSIWIQAVSVGEVLASGTLIQGLRDRYPDHPIWLSTTTQTGRVVATSLEGVDGLFYFPFDLTLAVTRVLDRVRPHLFVMVDTELWPNLLRHCRLRGVKTVLVNGRISDRSYPRYRFVRPFFRRVLAGIDRYCVQSEESGRRLIALGAPRARVTVTGNLKFDNLSIPDSRSHCSHKEVLRAFRVSEGRTVVIAASTHPGEEVAVLDAFDCVRRIDSTALLLLAPRHPERSGVVMELATGLEFETVRRSELTVDRESSVAVVVLDTVGELVTLFQIATVVFLGGSLVPAGGHNVLEPGAWGKPIVFGPHMENFAEIAELFLAERAAIQIRSADALPSVLLTLLGDPVQRAELGGAARTLVKVNRGATDRSLAVMTTLLPSPGVSSAGAGMTFR